VDDPPEINAIKEDPEDKIFWQQLRQARRIA